MRRALALAREAAAEGEVPVGCVIARRGEIVGEGRNRRETAKNALCHAEIEAIDAACRALGGWRLWECTLYVTLEPCPMCAGAIANARIARLVYGARDGKTGACGSVCNLFEMDFPYRPSVEAGLLEEESQALLTDFFHTLRAELKTRPRWKRP
ncbi:MAG: nucleoside deaminase [Firmicutes bacterium]|nr:nucleoside deaminase [Bacillota bacterium]